MTATAITCCDEREAPNEYSAVRRALEELDLHDPQAETAGGAKNGNITRGDGARASSPELSVVDKLAAWDALRNSSRLFGVPSASDFDFEAGWGRREGFRLLDQNTIVRLLAPILNGRQVEAYEQLTGGKANTNYRVAIAGQGDFVLRVYTNDGDGCARDLALLELVRGRVSVPRAIFAERQPAELEHPYALFEWVEGDSLMEAFACGEDQRDLGSALGMTLAAIGSHHFDHAGFFNSDLTLSSTEPPRWLDYVTECLLDKGTALDPFLASQALDFLHRHAALLPKPDDAAALVHGDYKAGNVLVRRSGPAQVWTIAAVLDWEFAFSGSPLFDLAPLLRFSHRLPPEFEQGVVEGLYEGGRALPHDWKRRVKLLDFADLCDFARQPGRGAKLAGDVSDLIAKTMREWDSYS